MTAAPPQLAPPAPPAARWDGDAVRDARQRLWQELCGKYPPRPAAEDWDATSQAREQVTSRLAREPFRLPNRSSQFHRQRGTGLILDWLEAQPGRTWQQRWAAAGAVEGGPGWRRLALGWHQERGLASLRPRSFDLVAGAGLLPLVCADVIRPGAGWLLGAGGMRGLAAEMERARDRDGFAALRRAGAAAPGRQNLALRQVAAVMAAKGGTVADITVGDCLELLAAAGRAGAGPGATSVYFYQLLHAAGMLPGSAPATVRAFRTRGQLSPAQMTGLYGIECQPVRELLADYLTERQPALDYASLRSLAHMLCRLFWRDLEIHHPGIRSLRLDAAAASAWRERLLAKTVNRRTPGGQLTTTSAPRADPLNPLTAVRAFYLDIAEWAIEDPARWGPWAAPSPVRSRDLAGRKQHSRRKARMDQRTRERLPVLPQLVAAAAAASAAARGLLDAAGRAGPGQEFTAAGRTLRRAVLTRGTSARTLADDPAAGRRRDLTLEEHRAFWSWAAIEVLRHTGIRVEELTELSHHSLIQYRLPGTGELIPLLQIAPSKTDTERLLVISPELADVLSAVVCRIRGADGAVPLAVAYDPHERTWLPPMPLLFQRRMRAEHRPIPAQAIRDLLAGAVAGLGIAGPDGAPLRYSPHDFRRMFITDAITHGMPPHIAQLVAGHRDINTTLGYKAVYPQEIIAGHRAFIARRRALRPSEEYRVPTEQEWNQFLGHFEHRKLSIGTCGRSYNTPCIHEHACVRCPLLRPDPAQKARLTEIRANLTARIVEAQREGWTGEAEGLKTSLAAADHKLAQMDQITASRNQVTDLGMPAFGTVTGRTITTPSTNKPDRK